MHNYINEFMTINKKKCQKKLIRSTMGHGHEITTLCINKLTHNNGVKTQLNIHKKASNSCSHIFMHKCNKVKSKKFQSLSNHHGVKY